jgi:hypothetical protein
MSWVAKLRKGEGPFWGRMKRAAKAALSFHLPVNGLTGNFEQNAPSEELQDRGLLMGFSRWSAKCYQ